jgi:pimeloyl-ACP methyl ester carboxylesterase
MQTERIPVTVDVDLAVDRWEPEARTATDVVLVHGLASNARMWDGVAAGLVAGGHRVVSVDLRGHGRSSKPDGPYDIPTVAGDLATLIERLGFERPLVAGQSWGGNVVLELAAGHPASVGAIVCVDGGWLDLGHEFPDWEACRRALAPPRLAGRRLDEIEGYIRSSHADWPESGIRGTLANFEVRPDGTIGPWLTFDHHITVLRGLWEHHPADRYADVQVPTLLAPAKSGPVDRDARKREAVDAAADAIPDARVRWFIGDHDIHAQHPDELSSVMHAFAMERVSG